jgi:hypothetical protein
VKDKHVTWLKQKTAQHSMPSKLPVQTGITGFFTSEFDHAKLKIEDDRYTDCRFFSDVNESFVVVLFSESCTGLSTALSTSLSTRETTKSIDNTANKEKETSHFIYKKIADLV